MRLACRLCRKRSGRPSSRRRFNRAVQERRTPNSGRGHCRIGRRRPPLPAFSSIRRMLRGIAVIPSVAGVLFLLGADSFCASAAVRIQLPGARLKWQLPAAFAVCDGLGSFFGSATRVGWGIDGQIASAISAAAVFAAIGLLMMVGKRPAEKYLRWPGRTAALVAIPLLLATDNFLAGQSSFSGVTPAIMAGMAAAASYGMSLAGLAAGEFAGRRLERIGMAGVASVALMIGAWAAS
jgi:hypothetical protein